VIPSGLIRVFPRRTRATPDDAQAFVGEPPLWLEAESVREVHVSFAFTWDRPSAERIAAACRFRFPDVPVRLGGPAYADAGGDFTPGLYLKRGYVITSRGCPNRCPFCFVPQREGRLRTLPLTEGTDLLDNNLLACPPDHIDRVLAMLRRQPTPARFTGGLEPARLTLDLARQIVSVGPERIFLAYDRYGQYEALKQAVDLLRLVSGWSRGTLRHYVSCYVLVGYPEDWLGAAEQRIRDVITLGIRAWPQLYRDETYTKRPPEWDRLIGGVSTMGGRRR
jgi:hypothetical protein